MEDIKKQVVQKKLEELFESVIVPTEEVTEIRRGRKVKIEYAGLARGEDPGLERAVEQFRTSHLSAIAEQLPSPLFKKGTP